MELDSSIIEEFESLIGIDVTSFIQDALYFFSKDQAEIIAFYNGEREEISSIVLDRFRLLLQRNAEFIELFQANTTTMKNLQWWLLIELFEDIDSRLQTAKNMHKWMRSSFNKQGYSSMTEQSYVMSQNETLERVAQDVLDSDNVDEWYNIALQNSLLETDYSVSDGGTLIKLYYNLPNKSYKIASIVSTISSKSIYGLDLYQKLSFVTDSNGYTDLKVLSYQDTIQQAISILVGLRKNDNPDAPQDGLQSAMLVGTNSASLNYPVVNRQMRQTFATDDTLKGFNIISIEQQQDNLFINYKVYTRLNEIVEDRHIINNI